MINDNSFYSVDRLVEFGLNMTMAQQMVRSMNQTMQSMYVPGSIQTMPTAATTQSIHVCIDEQIVGPLSESEFVRLIREQKIHKNTLVWIPGMLTWQKLETIPQLLRVIAITPPPLP